MSDIRDLVMQQGVRQDETNRRLKVIEQKVDEKMPCEMHKEKLKWMERAIIGLYSFACILVMTLIINIDKIKKALS
jgi:hypothetical protein